MTKPNFYEDFEVGQEFTFEPVVMTEQDILDWGRIYDRRPFHRDVEEAKESAFGRLFASGIQTLAVTWAPWVKSRYDEGAVVAGVGIDFVNWLAPIYPDMKLYGTLRLVDKHVFSSGKAGSFTSLLKVEDEEGNKVLEYQARAMVRLQEPIEARHRSKGESHRPEVPEMPDIPTTTGLDLFKQKEMFLEDYEEGMQWKLAPYSFTEEEIMAFGRRYDPRPIHVNKEAAEASPFGGIIASGLQTIAGAWGAWTTLNLEVGSLVAGMGINRATWAAPMRPGDELTAVVTVAKVRRFSRGDSGSVTLNFDVWNQKGEYVLNYVVTEKMMARETIPQPMKAE